MSINPADAAQAYASAAKKIDIGQKATNVAAEAGGPSFSDVLTDAVQNLVDTSKASEEMTVKGLSGEAEIVDVVTAISAAEMTLETVVAVRDKVISAYQDIMRMPI